MDGGRCRFRVADLLLLLCLSMAGIEAVQDCGSVVWRAHWSSGAQRSSLYASVVAGLKDLGEMSICYAFLGVVLEDDGSTKTHFFSALESLLPKTILP
jgi:hypothetical protein